MAVDDVVGLHVVGRFQNQNIVNNLSYRISVQGSTEENILSQLCEAFNNDITAAWVARHIDTYTLVGLKAFNLAGVAKIPGFLPIGTAGSVVGIEEPAALCRTITLYTASAKYRRRGRVQLSGGDVAMFDDADGSVVGTEITALTQLAGLMAGTIIDTGDEFKACIPANLVDPFEDIIHAIPRKTPSLIRSRRIRQFLIG